MQLFKISIFMLCVTMGCSSNSIKSAKGTAKYRNEYKQQQDGPGNLRDLRNLSTIKDPVPIYEPKSRYGNPDTYNVFNKTYKVLPTSKGYVESGYASWYGSKFHGFRTSSGEIYDMYKMTAAHKTLPLPTYAKVINLKNNRSIIVKINDRGPFHGDRILDLSYVAASKLGILNDGVSKIKLIAIEPAKNFTTPEHQKIIGYNYNDKNHKIQLGAFTIYQNALNLASRVEKLLQDSNHVNSKNYTVNIFTDSLQKGVKKNTLYKVVLSSNVGALDHKYLKQILLHLSG